MSKILPYLTAAALTLGGQALAAPPPATATPPAAQQTAPATAPANPATPPAAASPSAPAEKQAPSTASAPAGAAGAATAATATLSTGQSVKDNTGATIGQITELKPDASGHQMATIKMGSSTFAVDASKLAVEDGAATINLSKQQLDAMVPKAPS